MDPSPGSFIAVLEKPFPNECATLLEVFPRTVLGTLYNSQTVWYKIAGLGDYVRPIGQRVKESAASTAVDRMANSASEYQPANLKDFLARGGGVSQVS